MAQDHAPNDFPDRLVRQLRKDLHGIPELSGRETRTKALLMSFLREHTSLPLCPCGNGFYAAFRGAEPDSPGIALRADYDALPVPGGAAHLCGHDGHAAALCGTALLLEQEHPRRNVFLLFQPAEETGEGALPCCELFEKETVGEIYGMHNLPGFPEGQILTRPGTFACASVGVTLRFAGRPTHAAYPELGVSPASAVGELLTSLPELQSHGDYGGLALCTVIGCRMGEKAFGCAASDAEVWITLRCERNAGLELLRSRLLLRAAQLAGQHGLTLSADEQDAFPATENDPECAARAMKLTGAALLREPMRWSEDFGHYLSRCRGAFLGIGAGVNAPGLHTASYCYNDTLLRPAADAFMALIRGETA